MNRTSKRIAWAAVASIVCLAAAPMTATAQAYDVTITNLTKGQIFSPPIVYTHRGSFQLFEPGEAAIPELAGVAEDALNEPLIALLGAEPRVGDVSVAEAPVMPGTSTTVRVRARGGARLISALGMLVTTNDAFFFGDLVARGLGGSTYAIAWDAGSEQNTQDCAHIPGPPCNHPNMRVPAGAEGYVYVHAGIQDRGSLSSADWDWRNPVARIVVRRAQ